MVADEGNLDTLLDNARRESCDLDHLRWTRHAHAARGLGQLLHAALVFFSVVVETISWGHDTRQAIAGGRKGAAEFLGWRLGGARGGAGL